MGHRAVVVGLALLCAAAFGCADAWAQTPSPFDGHYVGTATLTGADTNCASIPKVAMRVVNGEAFIREFHLDGHQPVYKGTVTAAGDISAMNKCTMDDIGGGGARPGCFTISGAIHNNVFTGERHMGSGWHFAIQMNKMPN